MAMTIAEIFHAPQSQIFYAAASGETGHPQSYYATQPRGFERSMECQFNRQSSLCFDVSNNDIQASVDIAGVIQEARSARGLAPYHGPLRGVFVQKKLLDGGPWPIEIAGKGPRALEKSDLRTGLLANLFPFTQYHLGDLYCQAVTFAPVRKGNMPSLPVVIQVLHVSNTGKQAFSGEVSLPAAFTQWVSPSFAVDDHRQTGLYLMAAVQKAAGSLSFQLNPGEEWILPIAFILAETLDELQSIQSNLAGRSILEWFNHTLDDHRARLGSLTCHDPYYADGWVRFEELCRQSILRLPDGSFAGGTLGSNVNPDTEGWWNTNVWMKDNFYAALPMAIFNPELCRQAILFYMQWGVPLKARGRGIQRYPDADLITTSVSNALDGIVLATAYYQYNGASDFFRQHPQFLNEAKALLERLLATRRYPDIYLFPSMYVSDGDARGDFHTGSNIVAWYAFNGLARLAGEVYQQPELAAHFQEIAAKIRRDIQRYCKGPGLLGEQYFEGAYRDREDDNSGNFVLGHDGEESDVNLAPFYRFCAGDDPALQHFSQLAYTPHNPLYSPAADGIAWFDEGWACASTFPGFITPLAGADSEDEILNALERIRRLTDLDGSIWWWPHKLDCQNATQVARFPVKCCWAAGVYVLRFLNNILGIQIDRPARQVSLSPFAPWSSFQWEGCRLGDSLFDFSYTRTGQKITGAITNHTSEEFTASIELTLPAGMQPTSFQVNEEKYSFDVLHFRMRYQCPSYIAMHPLAPGSSMRFEVQYR